MAINEVAQRSTRTHGGQRELAHIRIGAYPPSPCFRQALRKSGAAHSTLPDERNMTQVIENNHRRYAPLDTIRISMRPRFSAVFSARGEADSTPESQPGRPSRDDITVPLLPSVVIAARGKRRESRFASRPLQMQIPLPDTAITAGRFGSGSAWTRRQITLNTAGQSALHPAAHRWQNLAWRARKSPQTSLQKQEGRNRSSDGGRSRT